VSAVGVDRGSGPAIVFAHGMQLDHRLFEPQVDALATEYRTVAYDLRARTGRGDEPYDLYDLVGDLASLLDDLEIDRCLLVGMSMGGYTAVRAALEIPERLHGVVLIGSSAVPFPAADADEWRTAYEPLRSQATVGRERARDDAELHFAQVTRARRPELVELWTDRIAERSGPATYNEFVAWAYQDDVRGQFAACEVPFLLVHGQEDGAVPLAHALETYALARSARLLVLPYAAHAPNLEHPDLVNDAIRAFAADVIR
jgi:pimeloyl-ACP methyl ester carboxylesterase